MYDYVYNFHARIIFKLPNRYRPRGPSHDEAMYAYLYGPPQQAHNAPPPQQPPPQQPPRVDSSRQKNISQQKQKLKAYIRQHALKYVKPPPDPTDETYPQWYQGLRKVENIIYTKYMNKQRKRMEAQQKEYENMKRMEAQQQIQQRSPASLRSSSSPDGIRHSNAYGSHHMPPQGPPQVPPTGPPQQSPYGPPPPGPGSVDRHAHGFPTHRHLGYLMVFKVHHNHNHKDHLYPPTSSSPNMIPRSHGYPPQGPPTQPPQQGPFCSNYAIRCKYGVKARGIYLLYFLCNKM